MNSAIPGDARDTSSPRAVTESLQKLTLGFALAAPQRQQFVDWLKGNTTGNHRIRAAVPADWAVGDKTGTCGVAWARQMTMPSSGPTGRAPIVLAVYTRAPNKDDKHSEAVIAAAARTRARGIGRQRAVRL
ncbi:serine hydrolase [Escherichia coli]|uniref:serine hydrolase n=1 Tax=Escherichia coli TaxID=562 RepID=UPI00388F27BC